MLVDDPKVRQGIIEGERWRGFLAISNHLVESLDWYSQFYLQRQNSLEAIAINGVTPEPAADKAIAKIKKIFTDRQT